MAPPLRRRGARRRARRPRRVRRRPRRCSRDVMPAGESSRTSAAELLLSTRSHVRAATRRRAGARSRISCDSRRPTAASPSPTRTSPAGCASRGCCTRPADARRPRGARPTRRSPTRASGARRDTSARRSTVAGLIRGGEAGLAMLREAVAELERSPAPARARLALIELGGALRRAGGAGRGARAAAPRAGPRGRGRHDRRGGARAGGAARHRRARAPAGALRASSSLTPSERRIVDLAAAGRSNPEIAQALFVTVKTVEMHLGHAYRKLGVHSRRELAGDRRRTPETVGSGTGRGPVAAGCAADDRSPHARTRHHIRGRRPRRSPPRSRPSWRARSRTRSPACPATAGR